MATIQRNSGGLLSRMATGLRNTIKTVSAGEAYLSKKVESKKTEKMPQLGVLQKGTLYRPLPRTANPFGTTGVRAATGPTTARPGQIRFKGTGGAYAPENGFQITSGMGGLNAPMNRLGGLMQGLGNNPQIQAASARTQQATGMSAQQIGSMGSSDLLGMSAQMMKQNMMEQAKMFQLQQRSNEITQMFQAISSALKRSHDTAMNSIRNMKG